MRCPQCKKKIGLSARQKRNQKNGGIVACSGECAGKLAWKRRLKTHCKRGHERTPENTDKDGRCKTCKNEAVRRLRIKNPDILDKYRARMRVASAKQRLIKKDIIKGRAAEWAKNNPEKIKAYTAKATAELPDSLIAKRLNLKLADAPPELIEIKRLTIQLQRSMNKCQSKAL